MRVAHWLGSPVGHDTGPVMLMEHSRQELVDLLRESKLPDLADEAARTLHDPVDDTQIEAWGIQRGLTKDQIVSWFGGSP